MILEVYCTIVVRRLRRSRHSCIAQHRSKWVKPPLALPFNKRSFLGGGADARNVRSEPRAEVAA